MHVFLSYTRNKDQFGAVSDFGRHFAQELALVAPGSTMFQDTRHIEAGDRFPDVLQRELDRTDVLLLLLSPAWLRSVWCRHEYQSFTDPLSEPLPVVLPNMLGLPMRGPSAAPAARPKRLRVLPVLWVETPMSLESLDPVVRDLAAIEQSDWSRLRHRSWSDPDVLHHVADLAARVVAMMAPQHLSERAEKLLRIVAAAGAAGITHKDFLAELTDVEQMYGGPQLSLFPLTTDGLVERIGPDIFAGPAVRVDMAELSHAEWRQHRLQAQTATRYRVTDAGLDYLRNRGLA